MPSSLPQFDSYLKQLTEFPSALSDVAEEALIEAAIDVSPVDTGALKRGWRVKAKGKNGQNLTLVNRVPYALYQKGLDSEILDALEIDAQKAYRKVLK